MPYIADILKNDFETTAILKALSAAHRHLGELKGLCQSVPNPSILIDSLSLQEAQDSSEIENIITTQDEILKYRLQPNAANAATKEVSRYAEALTYCHKQLEGNNLITINAMIYAQKIIKGNEAGVRTQIGTVLRNDVTNEVVYTPPQPQDLQPLLSDLERFINSSEAGLDPLIKMAIIHHQFESVHPFYDGNGRIGRIINIVYLLQQGLLDMPVLYLSRYINHNKDKYYQLLQSVRDAGDWQEWTIFMLNAVTRTAKDSIALINNIKQLQQEYKGIMKQKLGKIYSQELINNIFKHPYTKIAFLQEDLGVSRLTASRYLEKLTQEGLLMREKIGRENYYFNQKLVAILSNTKNMKEL